MYFDGRETGTWSNGASTYTISGRLRTGDALQQPSDGVLRGLRLEMSGEFPVRLDRARYAVTTNGSPVSATIFAGHDITNELRVNLLGAGSTINIDSKVSVNRDNGVLDLRATTVNFNSQTQLTGANGKISIFGAAENQFRAREQAEAVAEIVNGSVTSLVVPAGFAGSGYSASNPPTVTLSAPQSTPARATLRSLSNAQVASVSITAGGAGYTAAPIVRLTPPQSGGGRTATAIATIAGGAVSSVRVTDGGAGYTTAPVVSFEAAAGVPGGGVGTVGTGAVATANLVGSLGQILVLEGGSGYPADSVVPITFGNIRGGAGTGARGEALTNSSGSVYAIRILDAGSGYGLETTSITIDPPPPILVPDTARAEAIVDPVTSRISGFRITNPGSGYGFAPAVVVAAPPSSLGDVRPLALAETVLFNAGVAANIFDIGIANDPGTADVPRSRLLVSSSGSLTKDIASGSAASSVVVDAHQGDIFVAGTINATDQSYRLLSSQDEQEQDLAPFVFSTSAYATGAQTGRVIGNTVAVTLANDLETPLAGAFAQNDIALRTNVNSMRIRAARRDGRPIDDPFPYKLEINEVEDISFDAVAASSFPIVINGNGAVALRSAIETAGGIAITARGDFRTSAPVSTTQGRIEVTARSLAVTNMLEVTAASRDLTGGTTDILLTANGGRLVLEGDVSAVNDVRLVQRDPPAARITAFAPSEGNTLVRTAGPHLLQPGAFVIISGTVSYNGAWRIVRVMSDTSFEIAKSFVSNDGAGAIASPATTASIVGFVASAGNTLVRLGERYSLQVGDSVTITGTTNYDGTYVIAAVGSDGAFEIPRPFIADDAAGTAVLPAAGSLFGSGRVSGIGLVVEADGNAALRTNVRSADVRSRGSVSIDDLDDLRLTRLVASGRAAISAAGVDPGDLGYNPIALKVDDVTGISTLEVSAPNGSVDVTVNTSKAIAIGGAAAPIIQNMQAAGDVRIRSTAGALNIFDAPLAGGNARGVRAATSGPLLAQYDPGIAGIRAGELRGNGVINATGLFDGVTNLTVGDRVLVREGSTSFGMTTNESNGVYVVTQIGGGFGTTAQWRLTRALDSTTGARMPSNAVVRVGEGVEFANTFHRIRYASIPSDVAQFVAANALQLPVDYPGFGLLGPGQTVTGANFTAEIESVDPSNGVVTLDAAVIPFIAGTNVRGAGVVSFPTSALGFDEIVVEPVELTTNIGTDPFSTTTFVVSSTGGTNAAAGSLGKMLLLRQANDTSAETLNPSQRMSLGFANLAGPIELAQELPLIVKPIAIDGGSRFASSAAVGVPFGPIVIDGSRIVTNREGAPVRSAGADPEQINGKLCKPGIPVPDGLVRCQATALGGSQRRPGNESRGNRPRQVQERGLLVSLR